MLKQQNNYETFFITLLVAGTLALDTMGKIGIIQVPNMSNYDELLCTLKLVKFPSVRCVCKF